MTPDPPKAKCWILIVQVVWKLIVTLLIGALSWWWLPPRLLCHLQALHMRGPHILLLGYLFCQIDFAVIHSSSS